MAKSKMDDSPLCQQQQDWVSNGLTVTGLWGIPAMVMLLALLLSPMWRAMVWIAMLGWMGGACLANARRCGRTHCRYTGPYFLGMAGLVAGYIAGFLPLGSQPWLVLAILTAGGNALIWRVSEHFRGKYGGRERDAPVQRT